MSLLIMHVDTPSPSQFWAPVQRCKAMSCGRGRGEQRPAAVAVVDRVNALTPWQNTAAGDGR